MTSIATQTPEPTPAEPASNSPPKPETKRMTLAELGPRLPLGVVAGDGTVRKDLACKPWRGLEEREVGKMKAGSKEDFVTKLLAYMYTTVGPHDFTTLKEEEKRIIISSMFMGDVLYMYVWLRVQCIDKSLKMDLTCPRCPDGNEIPYDANLETIEVRTAENLEQVKWSYDLKIPFEIRGKEAKTLELAPTRWQTMEASIKAAIEAGDVNLGGAKMDIIQGCVRKIGGWDEMVLVERDYDFMMKKDIERLTARIDEHEVGPDMSIKENCPRCKRSFITSLDWGYESFFGDSSPS